MGVAVGRIHPKFAPRHVLLSGFAVALFLLGSMEWLSWHYNTRAVETAAMLTSSDQSREDVGRLQALILDLDVWHRTNLLNEELPSLRPLEDGLKSVEEQQHALEQLIRDKEQAANASALRLLLAQWSAQVQRSVELRQKSGAAAIRHKIHTGNGAAAMDQIKAKFDQMDARGRALFNERSAVVREEARDARLFTAAGTGLSLALFTAVFGLVVYENRRRQRAEWELNRTNEKLEQRVRERAAELAETTESLNRREHRFRALIEHGADSIALVDAEQKIDLFEPCLRHCRRLHSRGNDRSHWHRTHTPG